MKILPLLAAATVVAVVVPVTLALQRHPAPARPTGSGDKQQLWTGTATLLQLADADVTLCGGAVLTSLPPAGCGGAVVRGLDPMTVEGAHRYPNGTITTPSVRLVGTWDRTALTVTEPPVRAEPDRRTEPDPGIPGPSCSEPEGGWPFDRVDQEGWGRVQQYAASQPDAGIGRVDNSQRIFTMPFTGDLERHRAEIAKMYDGPVCVEHVKHSAQELQAVAKRAEADLKARGLQMMSGDSGSWRPYVEVTVVAVTPEEKAAIEAEYDGMLRLQSFLQPV